MKESRTYTFDEAFEASLRYFNGDELAARVWVNKYAMKDSFGKIYEKSPEDMHWRIANEVARIEKKYKNHLDTGNAILINVAPSKFTNIGHYMLIVGYNENGFILNDSNSIEYSQQEIKFDELSNIIRGAWTLSKN